MSVVQNRARGLTMVEVLIALAILSIVLGLAYGAITSSLRVQSTQEAATTTQAKLRRIVEVVSQDLRGAVFGSITDDPYTSGSQQVSFMMLTGGAGFSVLDRPNFHNATSFEVLMSGDHVRSGDQIVLVNRAGNGVVMNVSTVSGSGGRRTVTGSCRNTIDFEGGVLMFLVETTGIRYSAADNNMYLRVKGGSEQPFAFDLEGLRFDYVYTHLESANNADPPSETTVITTEPVRGTNGVPVRSYYDGDHRFGLTRIQLVIEDTADSMAGANVHAYSGQIDLTRAEHFKVEEIISCI